MCYTHTHKIKINKIKVHGEKKRKNIEMQFYAFVERVGERKENGLQEESKVSENVIVEIIRRNFFFVHSTKKKIFLCLL